MHVPDHGVVAPGACMAPEGHWLAVMEAGGGARQSREHPWVVTLCVPESGPHHLLSHTPRSASLPALPK